MSTLLERVYALLEANAQYIITACMKANSPAMLDNWVRKAKDYQEALTDACGDIAGTANTMERKFGEYQHKTDAEYAKAQELVRQGRDDLAMAAIARSKTFSRTALTYKGQWQSTEGQLVSLIQAKNKLDANIPMIEAEREGLMGILEVIKAKRLNLGAIKNLGDLKKLGIPEINDIAEGIKQRLDQVDGQLEVHTGNIDAQMDEVLGTSRDRADLLDLKRKMGLLPLEETPAPVAPAGTVEIET